MLIVSVLIGKSIRMKSVKFHLNLTCHSEEEVGGIKKCQLKVFCGTLRVNPFMTRIVLSLSIGPVHFKFWGFWVVFFIYSNYNRVLCSANTGDPDQISYSVASDLGLQCLHMYHNKDATLI